MIQYQVAITPLIDYWSDSEPSLALRQEALQNLQTALVQIAGDKARWDESPGTGAAAETLDVVALYALRAAAAWYEKHDTLDGFEATDAPWDHPIFDAFDDGERAKKFPHLLESDAEVAVYVPTRLPDVYFLSEYGSDDDDGSEIAVASLPSLLRELDTFAIILQVPEGLDPYNTETPLFDANVASNAPANWGVTMLRRRAYKALKSKVPLVIYAVNSDD